MQLAAYHNRMRVRARSRRRERQSYSGGVLSNAASLRSPLREQGAYGAWIARSWLLFTTCPAISQHCDQWVNCCKAHPPRRERNWFIASLALDDSMSYGNCNVRKGPALWRKLVYERRPRRRPGVLDSLPLSRLRLGCPSFSAWACLNSMISSPFSSLSVACRVSGGSEAFQAS